MNKVFVYGIFTDTFRRNNNFGRVVKTYSASLKNYKLSIHSCGYFKNIIESEGDTVKSIIMKLTDNELYLCDRIEGISQGLYRRIKVNTNKGNCWVYLE